MARRAQAGALPICSALSAYAYATPTKPDVNTLVHVKKMSNRRNGSDKRILTIPKRIRPAPGIELERVSLAQQHKFRTLSPLGQAIKIKAVEFLPGVHNPGAETALDFIARGIEIACDQLGLEIDAGLAFSATPIIGLAASSADFFGAGSRIVGTLATFAHKLSTLLAQTICFDAVGKIIIDVERSVRRIKIDSQLRGEWERFMLFGSGIFFNNEPVEQPLTKRQRELKVQLMSAIEVFGLANEYGHYIAQDSGALGSGKPKFRHRAPKLSADEIAWIIGQYLGRRCFAGNFSTNCNTWMESGAGAVALLSAVRAIRCTRDVIETGTHNDDGRPDYVARLAALEDWDGFDGDPQKERFKSQRWLVGRLVPSVFNELKMRFWAGHKAGFRPTPIDALLDNPRNKEDGLVEIVTKDVIPSIAMAGGNEEAFATYIGSSPDKLRANSVALEAALKAMRGETGGSVAVADQYLTHFQHKSVTEFAASLVKSKVGSVDPKIVTSVADRLSVGRLDGTRAGLQDCIDVYSLMLEPACRKLGLPLHGGVVCGIAWNPASGAAQLSVSENESIILVPESILMLCHFVSKLLAQALSIRIEGKRIAIDCDPESVLRNIRASETLQKYAAGGLAYCATWNRSTLTPLPTTIGDQRTTWYQLLMGTELFVFAHEYAHHIRGHGVTTSASAGGVESELSKVQELEADYYGALLSAHVGVEQKLTFAHYGTAAVIALVAVDLLRRTRDVLATGSEIAFLSKTHPPLDERLLVIQEVKYDPREADAVRANQGNFRNIMEGIWGLARPILRQMHLRGVRPLPVGKDESQWLPLVSGGDQSQAVA